MADRARRTVMRAAVLAAKLRGDGGGMKRVLFVCVENSNRSQMAEAFARLHGAGAVEAHSAGSRPAACVSPKAIAAMAERGIDIARQTSKGLDAFEHLAFDAAITMGCGDACPHVRARIREDWALADPRELDEAGVRRVRDEIERRVKALLERL
jgi:protein-tyrosine-phosphatase